MENKKEYIYVLINPSFSGKLKIGKTTNSPEQRAKELSSSTGVPTPFIVAYEAIVSNCTEAEKEIHAKLEALGHRFNINREFFDLPLKDAVTIVNEICQNYGLNNKTLNEPTKENRIIKSGERVFLEVLNEVISYGDKYYYRCSLKYLLYSYYDSNNQYIGFPDNIREKLELSSSLGYKPAKGWLLYEEAWSYFYGYGKIKDNNLFITKIIESFFCCFEGSYLVLAYIFKEAEIDESNNTKYSILYHEQEFNEHPNYNVFSKKSTNKLSTLDIAFSHRLELHNNGKVLTSEFKKNNIESSVNILKKGIKSNVDNLYPDIISNYKELCTIAINEVFIDFCNIKEGWKDRGMEEEWKGRGILALGCKNNDSDYIGYDYIDYAQILSIHNSKFKKEYYILVSKYFNPVKHYFNLYIKNGIFFQDIINQFLFFCESFKINIKTMNFTCIKDNEKYFLNEFIKCRFYMSDKVLLDFEKALENSGLSEFPWDNIVLDLNSDYSTDSELNDLLSSLEEDPFLKMPKSLVSYLETFY